MYHANSHASCGLAFFFFVRRLQGLEAGWLAGWLAGWKLAGYVARSCLRQASKATLGVRHTEARCSTYAAAAGARCSFWYDFPQPNVPTLEVMKDHDAAFRRQVHAISVRNAAVRVHGGVAVHVFTWLCTARGAVRGGTIGPSA